jgi:hypothetical protein
MANGEQEILDILDDEDAETDGSTSLTDIYAFLYKNEDIIIVIDANEEETVRRGLSLEKHKQQKKLKEAGAPEDKRTIGFISLGVVESTNPIQIRLQIFLRKRQRIRLHNMIVSDKEF